MINRARVGEARSAHISADGEMLAVGLKNGGFVVLNANNFKLWGQHRDRGQMINDIRYRSTLWRLLNLHINYDENTQYQRKYINLLIFAP